MHTDRLEFLDLFSDPKMSMSVEVLSVSISYTDGKMKKSRRKLFLI